MKFAHVADVHLGGWRDPIMRELNTRAFVTCIDRIIAEQVDFVLIAGDLFNTSMPSVDCLKVAVHKFNELKRANIPIYLIPGSHDFSPSGKSMLDVLEEAGLFINVVKGDVVDGKLNLRFTTDPKTGAKITGMLGKRGGLDKHYYDDLNREPLEREAGFRIFMFHCALQEAKPKELAQMEAMSVSLFPKGFDYYAGGHVHVVERIDLGTHKNIIYPGPVFPNSNGELEKLKHGTFVLYDNGTIKHIPIELHPVVSIRLDATGLTPSVAEQKLRDLLAVSVVGAIVTLHVSGTLSAGKPTDINMNDLVQNTMDRGARIVLKSTSALMSEAFEQISVAKQSVEEIELALIREHAKGTVFDIDREKNLFSSLMQLFSAEKDEGEKSADYEKRLTSDAQRVFG